MASENPDLLNKAIGEDGEINWDCPCLKDALEPPCGDKFKEAFSCYFRSTSSPKGAECVNAFEAMQKCYEENREIYLDRFKNIEDNKDSLNKD